jgi:hypothetical protein
MVVLVRREDSYSGRAPRYSLVLDAADGFTGAEISCSRSSSPACEERVFSAGKCSKHSMERQTFISSLFSFSRREPRPILLNSRCLTPPFWNQPLPGDAAFAYAFSAGYLSMFDEYYA